MVAEYAFASWKYVFEASITALLRRIFGMPGEQRIHNFLQIVPER
jgi:hypothetical protein